MTASAASRHNAANRNGFGLSALGLGVSGMLIGVFAAGAWFVVVPAGLLALILGIVGVAQKRHYVPGDVTAAVLGVLTAAVALTLGISGTATFLTGLQRQHPPMASPAVPGLIGWGQPVRFGDDVVVAISAPVPLSVPGGSVAVHVTITNRGTAPYHVDPSLYEPGGTFDGRPVRPVAPPDTPAATEIQPGRSLDYRVAYPLPGRHGELRLTVRPDPKTPPAVIGGQV
jgi:hypothetical protein